jgi:hypothetical protein
MKPESRTKDLDRDVASHPFVVRAEDTSHPSFAQQTLKVNLSEHARHNATPVPSAAAASVAMNRYPWSLAVAAHLSVARVFARGAAGAVVMEPVASPCPSTPTKVRLTFERPLDILPHAKTSQRVAFVRDTVSH